jgi:acylphosphatase
MSNDESARLHAEIDGRVQGVGFRMFVIRIATELNLDGWVRNRWNGRVEVVAEGERQVLEKLLLDLRNGPRSAFVSNIQESWSTASGEFTGFHIRPTG